MHTSSGGNIKRARIEIIPLIEGLSTTNTIRKMQERPPTPAASAGVRTGKSTLPRNHSVNRSQLEATISIGMADRKSRDPDGALGDVVPAVADALTRVEPLDAHVAPGRAHVGRGVLSRLDVAAGERDLGTASGQRGRDVAPDARVAPGHEDPATVVPRELLRGPGHQRAPCRGRRSTSTERPATAMSTPGTSVVASSKTETLPASSSEVSRATSQPSP